MLIANHPDDERLSALASHDADAIADARLTTHVTSCVRCTELVDELEVLRAALAELPDLLPSRPLQLVPPVAADHAVDRAGGWARRFFAPVLTAGAALALVGTVGTAAPVLEQMASGAQSGAAPQAVEEGTDAQPSAAAAEGSAPAAESSRDLDLFGGGDQSDASPLVTDGESPAATDTYAVAGEGDDAARQTLTAEQSPWPAVLLAGVALMIGAALLRWVLIPRAG
jgi:hypothetical protein